MCNIFLSEKNFPTFLKILHKKNIKVFNKGLKNVPFYTEILKNVWDCKILKSKHILSEYF